jgi:anti-anti-sigma factor
MNRLPAEFLVRVASVDDGSVRLRVEGELDLSTSPALEQALGREISAGKHVVLDLGDVSFIDSTGLNAVIKALRHCEANGATLALSPELSAQVRRVLEITGLDTVIPVASR